jgi:toxin FitB
MYIVDTNVVSELRKRSSADTNVTAWFAETPSELIFVVPAVLAELETGVRLIERRDSAQGRVLRRWLTSVRDEFADRCLLIDCSIGTILGGLHAPDRRPDIDAWIAATALAYGKIIVTRNERDFSGMGARTFDPWTYRPRSSHP